MSVYQPTPVFGGKAGSRPFWPLTPSAMSWAYVGMEPPDAYFSMRSGRMPSDAKNSDLSACGAGVYDSTRALAVPSTPWPTTIVKTASRPTKLSRRRRCIVPPPPRLCTGDPVDAAERATPTAKPIPACLLGSRRQMANSRRSTPPRAGPGPYPVRRMASFVTRLVCSRCGAEFDHLERHHLCHCGGPLLVDYDLDAVAAAVDREAVAARAHGGMWRFRELLPVEDPERIVHLGEGGTPLLETPRLARSLGVSALHVKDDGRNPTGSFKSRGAASGLTAAVERGVGGVALPTAGNAGVAWAAYGAAAGVRVHVAMPRDAPRANIDAVRLLGA